MSFRKVLCPIDFSPGSQHAMRVAARIAVAHRAELALANVWYLPVASYAGETAVPSDATEIMVQDSEHGLAQARVEAETLGAPRVSARLLTGVPWQELVDAARGDDAFDLVVMGTHGRSGLARIVLGSVTEQVVRHAPCPVLTVRDRGEQPVFRSILCPIDFSDAARRALELAAALVAPGGAGIALLHVLELPVSYSGEPLLPGYLDGLDRKASRGLEQWAAELRARVDVPVSTRTRVGRPGAQILNVLDRDPSFDLVITGSHGRTGLRRMLLGSVAEQVLRHARTPVAIAHARDSDVRSAA